MALNLRGAVDAVQRFWNADALEDADVLAPELDDPFEYIEAGDIVRVIPSWSTGAADHFNAKVVRTRPDIQWALVQRIGSREQPDWYSVDELYLILKATAVVPAEASTTAV